MQNKIDEKQEKIIKMFDDIAPTYDLANRVISFGVDSRWRKIACDLVLKDFKNKSVSIADIACGTGDMMGFWQKRAKEFNVEIKSLIGIDPSEGMIEVAKKKFQNCDFKIANACHSGLDPKSVDILSIAYGIRNVVAMKDALKEFNKIVKENGYVVVLEFTKTENKGLISKIRDFYVNKILPKIGALISKNKEAYEYLPNSIENFLDTNSFKDALKECGFECRVCKSFSFDVCTLFIAQKVKDL